MIYVTWDDTQGKGKLFSDYNLHEMHGFALVRLRLLLKDFDKGGTPHYVIQSEGMIDAAVKFGAERIDIRRWREKAVMR